MLDNDILERERLANARQTRPFYGGVADMWIWRRLNDPDDDFPKPILICGRRFWRVRELIGYRDRKAGQAA